MTKISIVRGFFFGCAFVVGTLLSAELGLAADVPPGIWSEWDHAVKAGCPSHHLELLGDIYDDLLGSFAKTLPRKTAAKVDAIADYSRRCADEKAGFYCEMAVNVDAFAKLGLLKKFTEFTCQRYKCIDGAVCVDPHTGKFR